MKKNSYTLDGRIFLALVALLFFVIYPYLYHLSYEKRKHHEENGIIFIKGVCRDIDDRRSGTYVYYKFEYNDTIYNGMDDVVGRVYEKTKAGDSIYIQVSLVDPTYNFLQ